MDRTRIEHVLDYLEIERMRKYIGAYQSNMELAKAAMANMPNATAQETDELASYISVVANRITLLETNLREMCKAYNVNYDNPMNIAVPGFIYDNFPQTPAPDDVPKKGVSTIFYWDDEKDAEKPIEPQKKKPRKTSGAK